MPVFTGMTVLMAFPSIETQSRMPGGNLSSFMKRIDRGDLPF
jgi:hypothetical protein